MGFWLCHILRGADEKYKKLKDGTSARYVYYGCTRSKNLHCKGGYIREEELVDQMLKILGQLDLNEIGMRHKFEEEVERINKFQKIFTGSKDAKPEKTIDLRAYAKYLLNEGSVIEKRELLACIKSKLMLTRKVLTLENATDQKAF